MQKVSLVGFVDDIAKKQFGRTLTESMEKGICVMCGEGNLKFTDKESIREYSISGMCQKCQDKVFG